MYGIEYSQGSETHRVDESDDATKRKRTLYALTKTGYKFLDVCVTLERSSRVNIILRDSHGKEISMLSDTWRELLEQRHVFSKYLQSINGEPCFPVPSHIENMCVRFGRINNLTILRLETPAGRLAMSKETVNNMFEFEHCVN
ncbi:hypothetical protein P5V15_004416 [Pogonomyrmex californicus]